MRYGGNVGLGNVLVRSCLEEFSNWTGKSYGNISRRIKDINKTLIYLHSHIHVMGVVEKIKRLEKELEDFLEEEYEEMWWRQRVQLCGLKNGIRIY